MDGWKSLTSGYETLNTSAEKAQCNVQMFTTTVKQETVQCCDEEESNCDNHMCGYRSLKSPNCVNYYDGKFSVSVEVKEEFPEDECPQSSTAASCINKSAIDSNIGFENEELSRVLETQELNQKNSKEAFSFIKTKEICNKKNQQRILDNAGDTSVLSEVRTTQDIQPKMCGEIFKKRLNLLTHSNEHLQVEPPTAVDNERNELGKGECCNEYFNNDGNMLAHADDVHSNEKLKSHKCDKHILKRKTALVEDTKNIYHDSGKVFKCRCGKQFRTQTYLSDHKYRQHGQKVENSNDAAVKKEFQCDYCKRKYQSKINLAKHIRRIHYDYGKIFKCWCGKQFRSPTHLSIHKYRQHVRKVEKNKNAELETNFQCDLCKRKFQSKGNLRQHIKSIHYDYGKIFKCWCGKQFRTPKYLSDHKYRQHGSRVENTNNTALIKEFQCDICKKIFKSKDVLKTHVTSIHYEYGKTFNCWCGKQFRAPRYLSAHKYRQHAPKVKHTNKSALNKELQCDICKKLLKGKNNLRRHITIIHYDSGKRFECWCGKRFRTKLYLKAHQRDQHDCMSSNGNKNKYKCEHCELVFKAKRYLACHVGKKHR